MNISQNSAGQSSAGTLEALKELRADLEGRIAGELRLDSVTRHLYSTDASMYRMMPYGVAFPKHEEDLQAIVESAARHRIPVLPRGGGTSLSGQCVNEALVLDMSTYMHQISDLNLEEGSVRVQPGVVQDQLNHYLSPHGRMFGPDTSTSNRATLGGMAGNNSSGSRSIIYGKTVDHVLEIDALLSDGSCARLGALDPQALAQRMRGDTLEAQVYRELMRIATEQREEVHKRFPRIQRRVAGYNLDALIDPEGPNFAHIVVGSEGSLALIRSLKVRIVATPPQRAVLVAHFDDLISAVEANTTILAHAPSAIELVDATILNEARNSPALQDQTGFLEGNPAAVMIVEFYGEEELLNEKIARLENDLRRQRMGYAWVHARTPAQQAAVWNVRKGGLGLIMGRRITAKPLPFVEDSAVPPERLAEYLREFVQVVKRHGAEAGYYGHASVGLLHIRPFIDLGQSKGHEQLLGIFHEVAQLVTKYGGSVSGEHGDGRIRSCLLRDHFGESLYQAFREVKHAFDPHNLMNPGIIVNPQQPLEHLRYGREVVRPLETFQDFSREGGFAFALEMCNGNGQCRKMDVGTMCPSYQGTREDRHSTRGRANALKGVLQGDLPADALTSHEMYEVMDLCLECKACRTECPSQVDLAKFKYEFLYHYQRKHGVPLRSRLFGYIAGLSRLGSATAPFSNLMLASRLHRRLGELVGIAPQRTLPAFSRQRFSRWFQKRQRQEGGKDPARPQASAHSATNGGPAGAHAAEGFHKVVLFHDTFTEYNFPHLGRDTVEILERAGVEVILVPQRKCCARPMISKGLLEQGRSYAQHNINLLKPHIEAGAFVVGIEPSCILTLREDYQNLCPGPDSARLAERTLTIDEALWRLYRAGQLVFPPTDSPVGARPKKKFLLHGHCHQRALVGTGPTLKLLRAIPHAETQEIPSGCCGMAGSFGYEKEHYALSLTIGEQRLFPAVRRAPKETVIVADGISCRQQIEHGTQRSAYHVVEVIAAALRDSPLA